MSITIPDPLAVADSAHEQIADAIADAEQHIEGAAQGLKDVARETVDQTVLGAVQDLHGAVQQLLTRDQFDPGQLEALNAKLDSLHGRMDEIGRPAQEALAALESVADAAAQSVEDEASDDAGDLGVNVALEDPTAPPASARKQKKSLFGKKRSKGGAK